MSRRKLLIRFVMLLSLVAFRMLSALAQESTSNLPQAPEVHQAPASPPSHQYPPDYFYRIGATCGAGASSSPVRTVPTVGCGVGLLVIPLPVFFEFGVMTPQANRSYLTGYISVDGSIPLWKTGSTYLPMAMIGYSRLFETGHSFDYGLALGLPRPGKHTQAGDSLRLELRDYWTFANPSQHNVMLRVGWMSELSD